MNKLFAAFILAVAMIGSAIGQTTTTTTTEVTTAPQGQVGAQSVSYKVTNTEISFLYLRDGYDNFAALNVPVKTLSAGKGYALTLNAIGAFDPNDLKKKIYLGGGVGLRFNLIPDKLNLDLVAGLKGLNIADGFEFQDGERGFVYGVGIGFRF